MPDQVYNPLAAMVAYVQSERDRNRKSEDDALNQKIALVHDLISGPGANPERTAQGYADILQLMNAKGGKGKQKGGLGGFMGEHEDVIPSLLAGLTHGDIPFQGPTHETIQHPGFENQASTMGVQPSQTIGQHFAPGFDGKSVIDSPVAIPPPPIEAAPTGNRMLGAARSMQTEQQVPPARQPIRIAPKELAQQEGEAAGIKAGAIRSATHDSDVEYWKSIGFSDPEIRQMLKRQAMGSSGNMQDAEGGIWTLPDGTQTRGVRLFNPADGSIKLVDERTGLPLPPGSAPAANPSAAQPSIDQQTVDAQITAEEVALGRKLTPAERAIRLTKFQNEDANRKRAINNIHISRNAEGLTGAQQFSAATKLQAMWNKESKAYSTMINQFGLMQQGLKQAQAGNLNSGSQAILVTFQKILDPSSVVRESEYARSPEGLGLMNRMAGAVERIRRGGAGVPIGELQGFVKTGEAFIKGLQGSLSATRGQVDQAAKLAGIDPAIVYGNATGLPETGAAVSPNDQKILDYFQGR